MVSLHDAEREQSVALFTNYLNRIEGDKFTHSPSGSARVENMPFGFGVYHICWLTLLLDRIKKIWVAMVTVALYNLDGDQES